MKIMLFLMTMVFFLMGVAFLPSPGAATLLRLIFSLHSFNLSSNPSRHNAIWQLVSEVPVPLELWIGLIAYPHHQPKLNNSKDEWGHLGIP